MRPESHKSADRSVKFYKWFTDNEQNKEHRHSKIISIMTKEQRKLENIKKIEISNTEWVKHYF